MMWDFFKQQIRAHVQAVNKKAEDKNSGKKKKYHLKRTGAQVIPIENMSADAPIVQARVVLNDLTPKGLALFTTHPFTVGQKVSLTIEEPKRFYVQGRVVGCQTAARESSKVISAVHFSHRVSIQFEFQSDKERAQVEKYCEDIYTHYLSQAA